MEHLELKGARHLDYHDGTGRRGRYRSRVGLVGLLVTLLADLGLAVTPAAPARAAGCVGTSIATPTDLQNVSNLSGSYCLTANLDLTGVAFSPIGTIAIDRRNVQFSGGLQLKRRKP